MFTQEFSSVETGKRAGSAVLIVEDERVSRRALAALLAAYGYATEAVESAEEALRVVKRGNLPDVALVDLDLPGMSGLDLINRLEQLDPSVFPVLITAAGGEGLDRVLREKGVAYMRKPVDIDQLLSLISEKQLPH